jgi:hypothetical protein
MPQDTGTVLRECPFEGCDWAVEFNPDNYHDELDADHRSEQHYEREHAGRVRVRVVLEYERLLGARTPQEVSDAAHEKWADKQPGALAFTYAEEIEPADDHERIEQ